MEDVDENLTCRVCLGLFDDGMHRPLLLPACGHTFCSFCIDNLHTKGKLKCPECRKDNAVKAISSLPVNYSLLRVVHFKVTNTSNVTKKQDEAVAKPKSSGSSLEWLTRNSDPPPTSRADGPTVSLVSSSPPKPMQRNPHRSSSSEKMPLTTVNWMSPQHSFNSLRRHKLCMGENSKETTSHVKSTEEEMTLQEELDFQMAVHLTFCKDASHGHDDPSCASSCWQFPLDDDINTAISVSRTYKD